MQPPGVPLNTRRSLLLQPSGDFLEGRPPTALVSVHAAAMSVRCPVKNTVGQLRRSSSPPSVVIQTPPFDVLRGMQHSHPLTFQTWTSAKEPTYLSPMLSRSCLQAKCPGSKRPSPRARSASCELESVKPVIRRYRCRAACVSYCRGDRHAPPCCQQRRSGPSPSRTSRALDRFRGVKGVCVLQLEPSNC